MPNFIHALQERDMLHNITPGTAAHLATPTTAYIGFDPTAPSLHIGNLATITLLRHFQAAGHRPAIVLGGATGMVGDPSFKAKERTLLTQERLIYHQAQLKKQIGSFIDLSDTLFVNNYAWLGTQQLLPFLRDIGKHLSINTMIAKDAVKNRLAAGLSYAEFTYQLLQAYDFYHLYTQHGVTIQMGGSDQWGNITTGIALIRKKVQGIAYGITTPLITRADGSKFGKTATGHNVWLDPTMTSPYAFYQFWLNCCDQDAITFMKKMTLYPIEAIEAMRQQHEQAPHQRLLQKELAKTLTTFIHDAKSYREALQTSEILFETSSKPLTHLSEAQLVQSLATIPHITVETPEDPIKPVDFLTAATDHQIFRTKRVARETIAAGGLRLNKQLLHHPDQPIQLPWLYGKYLLVQRSKKQFYLIQRQGKHNA